MAGAPEPKPLSQAYAAHAVAACHLPTLAPAPGRPAALAALQLARAAGTELDGSYANATKDPESTTSRRYYDAVATALLGVAAATPGGILVFFKSYQLLELATARWETTGGRARLDGLRDALGDGHGLVRDDDVGYRQVGVVRRSAAVDLRGGGRRGHNIAALWMSALWMSNAPLAPRADSRALAESRRQIVTVKRCGESI